MPSISGLTNRRYGISTMGSPVTGGSYVTTGTVRFVHHTGSDDYTGLNPDKPLATLDKAIGLCSTSKGDTIFVMPGHAETIIADSGVDIDVGGVSVIGLGHGASRPKFTLGTAVTADFKLAATNTYIENLVFESGIALLTGPIEVSANNCTIKNCEFKEPIAYRCSPYIITTTSDADGICIDGFKYEYLGTTASYQNSTDCVIHIGTGVTRSEIKNCYLYAHADMAVIHYDTTQTEDHYYTYIHDNIINNTGTTTAHYTVLLGTSDMIGMICDNLCRTGKDGDGNAIGTTNDLQDFDVFLFENYHCNLDGEVGMLFGTLGTS